MTMESKTTRLDMRFIERQRARLLSIREKLLLSEKHDEALDARFQEDFGEEAQDRGDATVDAALHEIGEGVHRVRDRRLADVERALEKIDEGTYGISDVSAKPIPIERLITLPEAIRTVEESNGASSRR
jgi:DnaK suppressor protein